MISGPNQVKNGSKSGLGEGVRRGSGSEGGRNSSVAPRKVSTLEGRAGAYTETYPGTSEPRESDPQSSPSRAGGLGTSSD